MKSKKLICGIDVSKDTLDTYYNDKTGRLHHSVFKNNIEGHNALIKHLGINRTYVLESTGVYSLRLCIKLKKKRADIRVENPLVIRRFIQMNMERHKSDKKDAKWLFLYGQQREAKTWYLPSKEQLTGSQILTTINLYQRKLIMTKNSIHTNGHHPLRDKDIKHSLEKMKLMIEAEIKSLYIKLIDLINEWDIELKERLLSIPSIGIFTIGYLFVYTDRFNRIQNVRQLIALTGTSPREYTSGTSVSVNKRICKMGNRNLRRCLYMCALNAISCNPTCKELYTRLKEAGKPSKVAIIAVCNKLLKQVFAIAKNGVPYQKGLISSLPLSSLSVSDSL